MNCRTIAASNSSETDEPEQNSLSPLAQNWPFEVVTIATFFFLLAVFRLSISINFEPKIGSIFDINILLLCLTAIVIAVCSPATRFQAVRKIVIALSLFQLSLTGMREIIPLAFYASREIPLQDDTLAAIDQALGFNWINYARSLLEIPFLPSVLSTSYTTIFSLPIFVCLSIIHTGNTRNLSIFIFSMSISLYITTILGATFPCVGAYEHFAEAAKTIPNMFGDKDSIGVALKLARAGAIDDELSTGTAIVQFPSYHACAGVLFIFAAWKTTFRIVAIPLSTLLIIATPIGGSHYLIDVLAGAFVGIAGWMAADLLLRWLAGFAERNTSCDSIFKYLKRFQPTREG